jgi:homoserine O-acetyltransferase/O-succinyltransferase
VDPQLAGAGQEPGDGKMKLSLLCTIALVATASAQTPANYPAPVEGDYVARDFGFRSGETLAELRLHYTTIGTPLRDASGVVRNAVLITHGTGGSGRGFLSAGFAGQLFGPGQLLDATKYFIILPDGIGHGRSSKPSDGLHMKFPKYSYDDMVKAQYLLVSDGLQVNHLRLVMGNSMGAMHTWVWGYSYPDFIDALMPLASNPVEIAGRNRMMRQMIIDNIENDSDWKGGEYTAQPRGLAAAAQILMLMTSVPLQWQKDLPTRAMADSALHARVARSLRSLDANDMIYAYEASREYNPAPHLEEITAPLYAINSADDQVNPPELGILDREIKRVKHGRYILIPVSDQTRGHGTHSLPAIWGGYLAELLTASKQPGSMVP